MKKVIMVIGLVSLVGLFVSSMVEAQVISPGVSYHGGDYLEFAESGTSFTVPKDWDGQYNQQEKMIEMTSQSDANLSVGYEDKSYIDTIADAKQPVTTPEGIVMTPLLNKTEKYKGDFNGEFIPYTGKALGLINVSAVALVIKMPSGQALTISSSGMGNDFNEFARQIGLVIPSLQFVGQSNTRQKKIQATTVTPTPEESANDKDTWLGYLSGASLIHYSNLSGYSSKEIWTFCSNGNFYRSYNSSSTSINGQGGIGADNSGRWTATGKGGEGTITLYFRDGTVNKSAVVYNYDEQKTYWDGAGYYRKVNQCN